MSRLPRYFEHVRTKQNSSYKLFSLSYDDSSKLFVVADTELSLQGFDPYTFDPDELKIIDQAVEIDETPNHQALIDIMGKMIISPKLHNWVGQYPERVATAKVVMQNAFSTEFEDIDEMYGDEVGHLGFAAGPREDGGIHLQVPGNCACMGPDPYGIFEDQFEEGFAEYFLHNADMRIQRASLYAGMGHLARLASEQQS